MISMHLSTNPGEITARWSSTVEKVCVDFDGGAVWLDLAAARTLCGRLAQAITDAEAAQGGHD